MFKAFFIFIIFFFFACTSRMTQEKESVAPEVVTISECTLKDSTQAEAFEKAVIDFLQVFNANFPGVRENIYQADRGPRNGKYIEVTTFDTKARRDYYFPQEGKMGDTFSVIWNKPEIQEKWQNVSQYFDYNWLGDFIKVK